jgi:hypothetical protein
MVADGFRPSEIARKLGVSRSSVHRLLEQTAKGPVYAATVWEDVMPRKNDAIGGRLDAVAARTDSKFPRANLTTRIKLVVYPDRSSWWLRRSVRPRRLVSG